MLLVPVPIAAVPAFEMNDDNVVFCPAHTVLGEEEAEATAPVKGASL